MKILFKFMFVLLPFASFAQSNVGIGTNTPDPSAKLEIASTNQGLLIPRMTQTQMNSISGPAEGLLVFQTNPDTGFYYHSSGSWNDLSDDLGSHTAMQNLNMNNNAVTNVPAPVNPLDAANKAYVDAQIANINPSPGGCCQPAHISSESASTMNVGQAFLYCDTLSESGYSDWHLPSDEELTLAVSGTASVPGSRSINWLWTRSHAATTWYAIRLQDGEVTYSSAGNLYKVRCVR